MKISEAEKLYDWEIRDSSHHRGDRHHPDEWEVEVVFRNKKTGEVVDERDVEDDVFEAIMDYAISELVEDEYANY